MDLNVVIEKNREALKRILAGLVATVALACGVSDVTLPRRVHTAVLRVLRPAESAARRLVIAAARSLVITLPPRRPLKPKPIGMDPILRSLGIAVVLSPAEIAARAAVERAAARRAAKRETAPGRLAFPLFDPPRNSFRPRRKYVPAHAAPRILSFDGSRPHVLPPPPSPNDLFDATRLGTRLQALDRVLNDLPAQARRFARWQARRDAIVAPIREPRAAVGAQAMVLDARGGRPAARAHRCQRIWPLRVGRPPGGRLSGYDPDAAPRRNIREVDEILAHAHALAVYALERPDTS